jgi:hypothetical protein
MLRAFLMASVSRRWCGAQTGDTARDNLTALRHEGVQQLGVLIIDVVDFLHAKPANFLAAEIRFPLRGCGLVASRGALSGAAGPFSEAPQLRTWSIMLME